MNNPARQSEEMTPAYQYGLKLAAPAWLNARNVGTAVGALGGGYAGYRTADPSDSFGSKASRTVGGAIIGGGIGRQVGTTAKKWRNSKTNPPSVSAPAPATAPSITPKTYASEEERVKRIMEGEVHQTRMADLRAHKQREVERIMGTLEREAPEVHSLLKQEVSSKPKNPVALSGLIGSLSTGPNSLEFLNQPHSYPHQKQLAKILTENPDLFKHFKEQPFGSS